MPCSGRACKAASAGQVDAGVSCTHLGDTPQPWPPSSSVQMCVAAKQGGQHWLGNHWHRDRPMLHQEVCIMPHPCVAA